VQKTRNVAWGARNKLCKALKNKGTGILHGAESATPQPERLRVQYRKTAALAPYARNARTHSENQIGQIAASIEEFGWTNPILVDGANGVVAGHGRLLAAQRLGLAQVPVIELAGLSEAHRRDYVIQEVPRKQPLQLQELTFKFERPLSRRFRPLYL
jgi:hypothetical protein